jgi:hypothetical protein
MTRLETISKKLSDKILKSSPEKQREIMIISCEFALNKSGIDISDVVNIIKDYKNNKPLDINKKKYLEDLMIKYDNDYFNIQKAEEDENNNKNEYLILFGKARAIATILNCFCFDLAISTTEAVYEANSVIYKNNELLKMIENVL